VIRSVDKIRASGRRQAGGINPAVVNTDCEVVASRLRSGGPAPVIATLGFYVRELNFLKVCDATNS
jgi:hypothetical protein